jgi:hypothetical protein
VSFPGGVEDLRTICGVQKDTSEAQRALEAAHMVEAQELLEHKRSKRERVRKQVAQLKEAGLLVEPGAGTPVDMTTAVSATTSVSASADVSATPVAAPVADGGANSSADEEKGTQAEEVRRLLAAEAKLSTSADDLSAVQEAIAKSKSAALATGVVCTNFLIPNTVPSYYFEVTVLEPIGSSASAESTFAIGLNRQGCALECVPGSRNSFAYLGSNGHIVHNSG